MNSEKIVAIILAIFLPPLAVFLREGLTGPFWIDLILTLIVFFPGMLFALYTVLKN